MGFHAVATRRRKLNRIEHLKGGNVFEFWSTDGMKHIARDYFILLFQKSNGSRANVINLDPASITEEDNYMLTASFTVEEFKHDVFSLQADKCPGPRMDLIQVFINIFGILVVMNYIKQGVNG